MLRLTIATLGLLLLAHPLASSTFACTTFCMDTPEGPIYGANLDLFIPGDGLIFVNQSGMAKEGWQESTTGEKAKWVSQYGSVTFNLAGREFAWGGMNEAGLVVGMMELKAGEFPKPDQRPPLAIGLWAQYMLDTCGNVQEAIKVDEKVRIKDSAPPIHYLIADAQGDCAVIEWRDGEYLVYTGDDLPLLAMANQRYDRTVAAYERGGSRWWWSNPGRSSERAAAAHDRCESFDAKTDTSAVNFAFGTLVYHVAAPHTKWNIVYDIAKREIWYRSVVSPSYKHISMSAFDFSCGPPLLMLDVNAPLEDGDVEKFFTPYDHEVNLGVFRTLCDRYDIEISAEVSVELMHFFEVFACAP